MGDGSELLEAVHEQHESLVPMRRYFDLVDRATEPAEVGASAPQCLEGRVGQGHSLRACTHVHTRGQGLP